jgi:hypothetical protein
MRKHSAPRAVKVFTTARLRSSPVVGTTYDATADTPNARHPSRFTVAIADSRVRRGRPSRCPETST